MRGSYLLSGLWPPFAEAVRYLDNWLSNYGVPVAIVSGYRSMAEQTALYAQGRTPQEIAAKVKKFGKGGAVTDAPAGYSAHNYGLAVDLDTDDPYFSVVKQVAQAAGFGTVSWDPAHIEWPGWQQLVGL